MLGAEALHRMPGDGHDVPVGNDQVIGAHARQPTAGGKGSGSTIPSADHPSRASHGQSACVGARDELAGAEATPPVSERTTVPLPPTRELSDADRAAIFGDADHTFLETVKLRGKLLGNYQFGSLKNARALNNYENRIIVGLLEYRKDKRIKDEDRVKDVVTEKALREIVGYAGRSMDSSVRYG